jgi:hypothetical protein
MARVDEVAALALFLSFGGDAPITNMIPTIEGR